MPLHLTTPATKRATALQEQDGREVTPKGNQLMDHTTATPLGERKQTRSARPETRAENFIDICDVLAINELKAMPVVVAMTTVGTKARNIEKDGELLRDAGLLRVQLVDEDRSIKIILFEGATSEDLERLRGAARQIRSVGHPFGVPALGWQRVEADWADELTFSYRFTLMPRTAAMETSRPVVPCRIAACPESWHSVHDQHTILAIHRAGPSTNYEIAVEKDVEDLDARGWYVNVYADDFFASAPEAALFGEDLLNAADVCRRANAFEGGAR